MSRAFFILGALVFGSLSISAQTGQKCPSISITGPAGVIQHGDTMTFTANVGQADIRSLTYEWMVSAGTIVEGQGTPTITVGTDRSIAGKITASVIVNGLPTGCKNSTSQQATMDCGGDPPVIDEYGPLRQREEITRLDLVLSELKSRPDWIIYVIEYSLTESALKSRTNWLRQHFRRKKIPSDHVQVISGGSHPSRRRRTKIYLVPPVNDCLSSGSAPASL